VTGVDSMLHGLLGDEQHITALERLQNAWDRLRSDAESWLAGLAASVEDLVASAGADTEVDALVRSMAAHSGTINDLKRYLAAGDFAGAQALARRTEPEPDVDSITHYLETAISEAEEDSEVAEEDVYELRDALDTIADVVMTFGTLRRRHENAVRALGVPVAALSGRAGYGKSQYAAGVVASFRREGPLGVLLHGKHFRSGANLEQLPTLLGYPGRTVRDVFYALNASGVARRARVPVVIDGLNESLDVSIWRGLLGELGEAARDLPNVVVIVTVRDTYGDRVFPARPPPIIYVPGFADDVERAARRYLRAYRIRLQGPPPPDFADPLLLRIFCEATNPARRAWVDATYTAWSRYDLYDEHVRRVTDRIRERLQLAFPHPVAAALRSVAASLWSRNARSLALEAVLAVVGEDRILLELCSEGLLIRSAIEGGAEHVAFTYDALAGHVITHSIVPDSERMRDWVETPEVIAKLGGADASGLHPLCEDINRALVHLAYRAGMDPTDWNAGPRLALSGLLGLLELQRSDMPAAAVERLAVGWVDLGVSQPLLFETIRQSAADDHPLNAEILDRMLAPVRLVDRDLSWTEWVREHREAFREDLDNWIALLGDATIPEEAHHRRAHFTTWLLTSTDRALRDVATRFLYSWGRRYPRRLVERVATLIAVDDPYICERLLAATYGVAMAGYPAPDFADILRHFGDFADAQLLDQNAEHPTTHLLSRSYAMWTADLAARYAGLAREPVVEEDLRFPHAHREWGRLSDGDDGFDDVEWAIHMDFSRYTIGRLVRGRPDDEEQASHQEILAGIRWRIRDLGYTADRFTDVDREIAGLSFGQREEGRLERYGKKYSWIAFYEMAGRLQDAGMLESWPFGRLPDADIDPSFPDPAPRLAFDLPAWAEPAEADDLDWLQHAETDIPEGLIEVAELDGQPGPWVLADGHLTDSREERRRVFLLVCALGFHPSDRAVLEDMLLLTPFPGDVTEHTAATDHYLYAGEIPWSPLFGYVDDRQAAEPRMVEISVQLGATRIWTGPPYDAPSIEVEPFGQSYGWESYHSVENRAGGAVVPSPAYSRRFDLRGRPQTFDLFDPSGERASISCRPPVPFGGHLLYLRRDQLSDYLVGRRLQGALFAWGERQLLRSGPGEDWTPEERSVLQSYGNVFRRIWLPTNRSTLAEIPSQTDTGSGSVTRSMESRRRSM